MQFKAILRSYFPLMLYYAVVKRNEKDRYILLRNPITGTKIKREI